jgi:hypothetical protein
MENQQEVARGAPRVPDRIFAAAAKTNVATRRHGRFRPRRHRVRMTDDAFTFGCDHAGRLATTGAA